MPLLLTAGFLFINGCANVDGLKYESIKKEESQTLEEAIVEDIPELEKSVVYLETTTTYQTLVPSSDGDMKLITDVETLRGTGICYMEKGGEYYIATAHHVASNVQTFPDTFGFLWEKVDEKTEIRDDKFDINKDDDIILEPTGKSYPEKDIFIFKTKEKLNVCPCSFGDAEDIKVGRSMFIISYPQGELKQVNFGHITNREYTNLSVIINQDYTAFTFDASVSPGGGGAPIFLINGPHDYEIIGFLTAYRNQAQNLNYGLRIDEVKEMLTK